MKIKYPVFAFSIFWFIVLALIIASAFVLYESKLGSYSYIEQDASLIVACWSVFGVIFDRYLRGKQPMKLNFWGKPMLKTDKEVSEQVLKKGYS